MRHVVKKYVIASKLRHDVKLRLDIKKYVMT